MAIGFGDFEEELMLLGRLRAEPPGYAAQDDERRRVFGAALHQFEELIGASARSGPASSPLLLFYAISQAGRAVAAARCPDPRWNYQGHGLKVEEHQLSLARTMIHPQPAKHRGDAFSVVSESIGSAPLSASITLARLWASLPEIDPAGDIVGNAPVVIWLNPEHGPVALTALLDLPEIELPREEWPDAVAARLRLYPHAGEVDLRGPNYDHAGRPLGFSVAFASDQPGVFRLLSSVGEPLWDDENRYLRPAVNDAGDLPTSFMSWWALLLALSVYARYVPGAWYGALARDSSRLAIPLERTLRYARRTLPRHVLYAITGRWEYDTRW